MKKSTFTLIHYTIHYILFNRYSNVLFIYTFYFYYNSSQRRSNLIYDIVLIRNQLQITWKPDMLTMIYLKHINVSQKLLEYSFNLKEKKNIYNTDLEIKTVNLYNILFFTVDFVQVIYIL
jgi:hypothetical protein